MTQATKQNNDTQVPGSMPVVTPPAPQPGLEDAAARLEALGNPTRLEIFRLLVRAGHAGAPVGQLQQALGIPASTLSHHLAKLVRVGLVRQERQSRTLLCHAEYAQMNALLAYLTDKCCKGLQISSC